VNLVTKKTRFSATQKGYGRISNVLFENVRVGGRYLRSARDGNFAIDPGSTRNVRFLVSEAPR